MTDAAGPHGSTRTRALIVVPILTAYGRSTDAQRRQEEVAGLAEAIDLDVRRISETRLTSVRPSTLFGTGKTDEIKSTIAAEAVEVAMVDHPLRPVQQGYLDLAWDCKVLDRTAVLAATVPGHA